MSIRSRGYLRTKFRKGDRPDAQDFIDLFDSFVNFEEDKIEKISSQPLRITAETGGNWLDLTNENNTETWRLSHKNIDGQKGFNLSFLDVSKLYIENNDGKVGLGSINPQEKLHISGAAVASEGFGLLAGTNRNEHWGNDGAFYRYADNAWLTVDNKFYIRDIADTDNDYKFGFDTNTGNLEVKGNLSSVDINATTLTTTGNIITANIAAANISPTSLQFATNVAHVNADGALYRNNDDLWLTLGNRLHIRDTTDTDDNYKISFHTSQGDIELNGALRFPLYGYGEILGGLLNWNNADIPTISIRVNQEPFLNWFGTLHISGRIINWEGGDLQIGYGNNYMNNKILIGDVGAMDFQTGTMLMARGGIALTDASNSSNRDSPLNIDGALYRYDNNVWLTVDNKFYIRDMNDTINPYKFSLDTDSGNLELTGALKFDSHGYRTIFGEYLDFGFVGSQDQIRTVSIRGHFGDLQISGSVINWESNDKNLRIGYGINYVGGQILIGNVDAMAFQHVTEIKAAGGIRLDEGRRTTHNDADGVLYRYIGAGSGILLTVASRFCIRKSGSTATTFALEMDVNTNQLRLNGALVTTSDARLKTNIKPLENVLEKIAQINGIYFQWNDHEKVKDIPKALNIGLIADEVEAYFPELINSDEEGFKSLNYSNFTAVLLEAIKEQQALITAQQEKISQHEQKLLALEKSLQAIQHRIN